MTNCPNKRCPIITVCKAHEDNIPAMCYYRDSRGMLEYPETRQLMSSPGHHANEESYGPMDCSDDFDSGDHYYYRRA